MINPENSLTPKNRVEDLMVWLELHTPGATFTDSFIAELRETLTTTIREAEAGWRDDIAFRIRGRCRSWERQLRHTALPAHQNVYAARMDEAASISREVLESGTR
jgi:hypothetical protein